MGSHFKNINFENLSEGEKDNDSMVELAILHQCGGALITKPTIKVSADKLYSSHVLETLEKSNCMNLDEISGTKLDLHKHFCHQIHNHPKYFIKRI